jgi:hypothetical protein
MRRWQLATLIAAVIAGIAGWRVFWTVQAYIRAWKAPVPKFTNPAHLNSVSPDGLLVTRSTPGAGEGHGGDSAYVVLVGPAKCANQLRPVAGRSEGYGNTESSDLVAWANVFEVGAGERDATVSWSGSRRLKISYMGWAGHDELGFRTWSKMEEEVDLAGLPESVLTGPSACRSSWIPKVLEQYKYNTPR